MDSTLAHDAFAPPPRPAAMRSGLVLALIVHALLIAALAWSVNWRISENDGVVAELWAPVPQVAAPRAAAPEPRPEPAPAPAPTPKPEVQPPPPAPRPDAAEAARAEAQIAIEREAREKARREETERLAAEKVRLVERERRDELRRQEVKRDQERQKERERVAQEETRQKKLAVEQARKKELAEEQAQQKELAEKARKDEARLAANREANLKRMMGQAGATGEPSSTGTAARTAGPSSGYAGRIKARIKPNIVLTNPVDGNPVAEVELSLAPDGTIVGRKLVKKSGSAAWDETVLRAVDRTEVLPRDTDGRVPSSMVIEFRPRE